MYVYHIFVKSWISLFLDGAVEFGTMKYYALCGFGGILSCGITHTAVVPLDLVKCRIQVSFANSTNLWLLYF